MADFECNDNVIRYQKTSHPDPHVNVADSGMVALTDEPLPCRNEIKNNEILNVNLEQNN